MPDDLFTLRSGNPGDFAEIRRVVSLAFNEDPDEPEPDNVGQAVFEPDRAILGYSGDTLVGAAGVFTRELTVPGEVITAAHVTGVGVDPAHRRRGLLTRMMTRQLADIRARGEAVALLWASEGRIYQRYGYGMASQRLSLGAEREARLRDVPPAGGLRTAVPTEVVTDLQKVFDQVRTERVGWSSRDGGWWDRLLFDAPSRRQGASALRAVLHEGDDGVDGYALLRVRADWGANGPDGEVLVREAVTASPDAYRALWHHLLTVDLTRRTSLWLGAVDEPLQYLVDEPRRLGCRVGDGLWVRLVDVPAALAARRYAGPVDVVVEVVDPLLPENSGAWHLTGDRDGARCVRTQRRADLGCHIAALGAAYLGGTSLATLAAGGMLRELVPGSLAPAATAFGWHRAPSAIEIF